MKVSSVNSHLSKYDTKNNNNSKVIGNTSYIRNSFNNKSNNSQSFGSMGMAMLGMSSAIMQWIESKGYLVSFLIQDGLGMTAPRVWTGFHRDKEITGEYNIQEGLEVLGREGITGPYLMAVAPAVLAVSGKFCKSIATKIQPSPLVGGTTYVENLLDCIFISSPLVGGTTYVENLLDCVFIFSPLVGEGIISS